MLNLTKPLSFQGFVLTQASRICFKGNFFANQFCRFYKKIKMDQSKTELLLEYQSRIDQKARENSSDLISNGTTEHAKILIKTTIFGKA